MHGQRDAIYILGHTEEERQRLIEQSAILGRFTEEFLSDARIGPGMRVLDVGCGAGDVALLVAQRVGPAGRVTGVDRDPLAVALARERARQLGVSHVNFVEGDLRTVPLDAGYDAAVGRFVLMYLADPVAALGRIADLVRPGGVVAFQEFAYFAAGAYPPSGLWDKAVGWWRRTAEKAGIEMNMGLRLYETFVRAGLPPPQLRMDTCLIAGPDPAPYRYIARTLQNILPMMERFGVATREEVAIETFAERLRQEVVAGGGVIAMFPVARAWVQKTLAEGSPVSPNRSMGGFS